MTESNLNKEDMLTKHLQDIRNTQHTETAPLSYAISKFRENMRNTNSCKWVSHYLRERFTDDMMIKQKRPRCRVFCSKNRVDVIDFKLIWDAENTQYLPVK